MVAWAPKRSPKHATRKEMPAGVDRRDPAPTGERRDGGGRLLEREHQRGDAVPLEAALRGVGAQRAEGTEGVARGEHPFTAGAG
jgi:hypothetical protein